MNPTIMEDQGERRGWAFYRQETVIVAGKGADSPNKPLRHSTDSQEDDGDSEKLSDGNKGPRRRK